MAFKFFLTKIHIKKYNLFHINTPMYLGAYLITSINLKYSMMKKYSYYKSRGLVFSIPVPFCKDLVIILKSDFIIPNGLQLTI